MMFDKKRLTRLVVGGTFLTVFLVPAMALAQEGAEATVGDVGIAGRAIAAALAMGISAIGAGWAQAKIGSAGQATLAERPEERIWVIALTAIPEVIVLLGFVMAILING